MTQIEAGELASLKEQRDYLDGVRLMLIEEREAWHRKADTLTQEVELSHKERDDWQKLAHDTVTSTIELRERNAALTAQVAGLRAAVVAYESLDDHSEECPDCDESPCQVAWDLHGEAVKLRRIALAATPTTEVTVSPDPTRPDHAQTVLARVREHLAMAEDSLQRMDAGNIYSPFEFNAAERRVAELRALLGEEA